MRQSYSKPNVGRFFEIRCSIVHTVIRKIDTFVAGISSSEIRLKTTLPQFCDLNHAVRRALTQYTSNCCLLAQCKYASSCDSAAFSTAEQASRSLSAVAELLVSHGHTDAAIMEAVCSCSTSTSVSYVHSAADWFLNHEGHL